MTPADWKLVQIRLVKFGFNPGPIDGVRGRLTTNAVRRFQESVGLLPDGIVGPITHQELFMSSAGGRTPAFDTMPWYDEARRLIGLTEEPGKEHSNVDLLNMADDLDIDYDSDDIPWCGLFVAHCIGSTLGEEPLPAGPLGARNWLKFGIECTPQLGSVLVFWRGKKSGWTGHVGFYAGEDTRDYYVLGGNQSDAVNITKIRRNRLLGGQWPLTGPLPENITLAGAVGALEGDGNEA